MNYSIGPPTYTHPSEQWIDEMIEYFERERRWHEMMHRFADEEAGYMTPETLEYHIRKSEEADLEIEWEFMDRPWFTYRGDSLPSM